VVHAVFFRGGAGDLVAVDREGPDAGDDRGGGEADGGPADVR
jgi:hypothetical protein